MDTLEVKLEFLRKTQELAHLSQVPEVRAKLEKLADQYNRAIESLERENSRRSPGVSEGP